MSDDHLRLIPTDPYFIPHPAAIHQALDVFDRYVQAIRGTSAEVFTAVQFVDQGSNFERILCPNCRTEVATQWWQQAMDESYEGGFLDLKVSTPCCGFLTTLNDLQFEWPAGFACFILEAVNPHSDLSQQQISNIEQILGKPVRKIWAHY